MPVTRLDGITGIRVYTETDKKETDTYYQFFINNESNARQLYSDLLFNLRNGTFRTVRGNYKYNIVLYSAIVLKDGSVDKYPGSSQVIAEENTFIDRRKELPQ